MSRVAHMYVWQVCFQASQAPRPALFVTTTARVQARTEREAWAAGEALCVASGWTIRERTGRAARGYRVPSEGSSANGRA